MDQLTGLRQYISSGDEKILRAAEPEGSDCFFWTIASGKGGVGKTVTASALALLLAEKGFRVLLVDSDLALPNMHMVFDVPSRPVLSAYLAGTLSLADAVTPVTETLHLLVSGQGGSDHQGVVSLFLEKSLSEASTGRYDIVMVDSPNGFGEAHRFLARLTDAVTLVTTSEHTSVANAYAYFKLLRAQTDRVPVSLVVNQVRDSVEAEETIDKLNRIAEHFLKEKVAAAGWIPTDPQIREGVRDGCLLRSHEQGATFMLFAETILQQHSRIPAFRKLEKGRLQAA